jgi:acetate kinase
MKILVVNAGSSSLKVQLLESRRNYLCLYKGMIDGMTNQKCLFTENYNGTKKNSSLARVDHQKALQIIVKSILKKRMIKNLKDIEAIGHRVVHGGEKYKKATKITGLVLKTIKELCSLAPLHNPPNLAAIMACLKLFPSVPQVAVFDTAFHQTLPGKAYLYALPYTFYQKMGIRRYGFHGTSHAYVAKETIKLLKKKQSKIVTCHLGNGSSITAIKNGQSIDTSMGFTPLEGVPMGTRSGDIDPAISFFLMKKLKKNPQEIEKILNKESGLLGVSEISADVRDLWALAQKNNPKARRAFGLFAYRIAKYIGSYCSALNGLDALTFTAGIGQNAYYLRQEICDCLEYLGVSLDRKRNERNALQINSKKSKVKVFVIPTNEEKEIARETEQLLLK